MKTKTSLWVRFATSLTALVVVFTSFAGQASARIVFQDDDVGAFESEILNLGSNDTGANNTSIQFGADSTASENGVINWNVTTNTFEVDHSTAITGDLSATGQVNFSAAAGTRIREVADPATTSCANIGELVLNTTNKQIYTCTATGSPGTWSSTAGAGSQDFEGVYTTDGDQTLTTSDGIFTINTGTNDFVVDSNDWNVTASGALDAATITSNGLLTGSAGATISGGAVSLNNNSNNAVNIGTGTSTGAVSIGGGSNTVGVDSTTWDISTAGVASGLTGLTSTGVVDFSGASRLAMQSGAANPGTCTEGDLFYNTTDNLTYTCTAANTWTSVGSGSDAGTLDGLDSLQFLRSDVSDTYGAAGTAETLTFGNAGDADNLTVVGTATLQVDGTLDANGVVTIGDNGDTVAIDSSDWDISAAGALTGISGITNDSTFTTSGGAVSVNNNSNFATDINTGTSTGAVSIGGGSNTVAVNSSSWDITNAGAASGFTTVDASGNFTTSVGTFCVGTTCLNETTSAIDSGAYLVGVFDEFDNSASTTVQGVLNDLDAAIGSNSANNEVLTFYPEYPDAVTWADGGTNNGTLTSEYDDTNDEHYYHWTSNRVATQDIDQKFRFPVPADFASTGDFTYRFRTGSVTEADNDVEVYVYNATDETGGNPTLCGSDTTNGTAGVWATGAITAATLNTGCTGGTALSAGDIIEVDVKLFDNSGAADYADVGYLSLAYNN